MMSVLVQPTVIEGLTLVIGVFGLLLVAMLFFEVRQTHEHNKLKRHRVTNEGFVDLLNYAAVVDDGVIVCKNGALMAAWLYEGDDNASSTDEQREITSVRINQAIGMLGNEYAIHVDAIRRNAPGYSERGLSHFPDRVTAAIDEERRRYFGSLGTMFEGSFVFTLTWYPPLLAQKKFVDLMFDDDRKTMDRKEQTYSLIDTFNQSCANVESRLSSVFRMRRLKGHKITNEDGTTVTHDDFLRHLHFCVTGLDHPIVLPANPIYLDALIGGQEMWSGTIAQIGRKLVQCVAIDGFPMESYPGMLSALAELPVQYRWSSRFIFMDQHEAVEHLEKFRKKWRQKVRGFWDQVFNTGGGRIDRDAADMVEDAELAIAEVNSGIVGQVYYTSVVVLMDEDRDKLEAAGRQIEKTINSLGFTARVETINAMDAFFGSLPGHCVENIRRPAINTMNGADLLPVSTIWTGESKAPCPMYPPSSPALMQCVTDGRTPFWYNAHVRDLAHQIIFGPTGAGKSTLLAFIAAQLLRYLGMTLFVFDKGLSMYPLCKAAGGDHYSIAGDNDTLAFCPLQYMETPGDRSWVMQWIETLLALSGLNVTPAQRNEIGNAVISMHSTGSKTLSEFVDTIQDIPIREALLQYTRHGMMGHLLDADEDGLSLGEFSVFEIEELMNLGDKYALPVLLYLFRRIERSLHGQPAAIILDEAWIMLGHPVFREKIREWLKVMRKANCAVIMATQSLTDAARSGILDVIVESTASKVFLPNVYARDEDTANLYKRMGLNSRQIEILATAIPKQQYYYVSEKGRRLFELALGPLALSFVGATDKESLATIRTFEQKYRDAWVDEWLKLRDLHLSDYLGEQQS